MHLTGLSKWAAIAFLSASAVVCILGIAGYCLVPSIIRSKISEQMRLLPEGQTLKRWSNVSVPIYFSVYMFNITNPEEFMMGERPEVYELGPYVFLQKRRKLIEQIDKDVVTYAEYKSFHFIPEYSKGVQSDMMYALNVPMVAMNKMVGARLPGKLAKSLLQPILEGLLDKHHEKLVVHRSVGQMLFEGYDVPMLGELAKLARAFMPDAKIPANAEKFGLFYKKNDTADQWFTVGTGAGRFPFSNIIEWNNQTNLSFWSGDDCNMINGTDGGQFPPFVKKEQKLYAFATDLCRSIHFEYEKPSQVKGVETSRFTVPANVFAGVDQEESNRCFCEAPDKCRPGGVIPLSACRKGAPVMLSAPHFYLGDQSLRDAVVGLKDNKLLHETFLDVQLMTGLVLRAAKRLQINIDLQQSDLLFPLANITSVIMPIGWIEERVEATTPMTEGLKEKLIAPQKMGVAVSSGVALAGAVGFIGALLVIAIRQAGNSRSAKLSPIKH